ncbi:MAG: hypothetical protein Q7S22_00300 [Candidatus Micrarchaeota archaeon]|nr:hypothetical protein [Candidatus Micrarchaeota archaeon]
MAAKDESRYGEWAFLLGVVMALIVGLFSSQLEPNTSVVFGVLALLGLVVGLLNITEKDINSFLIASIALLASSSALSTLTELFNRLGVSQAGEFVSGFVGALGVFVAPAVVVLSLKAIYSLATKK